jgi:long-subunit fatty acid transport protein
MRRVAPFALSLFIAIPAAAQNTDIESLSGLQFNFGNPGARSLGMGGAFLGLADDASAAEANPAGLMILRRPEVSIEARNYLETQFLTTSGTFPDLERTGFTHYSNRVQISFASVVYPFKNNKFTVGGYFHEPLSNEGAGLVIPQRNEFSGAVEKDVPNFYLPRNGTPVGRAECEAIRREQNDFFACLEYTVNPFLSALDVKQRTFGLAGAWQVLPKLSVGATVRYQTFSESSFTFRVTPDFEFSSISVQTTARRTEGGEPIVEAEDDITFAVGFKFTPTDKIRIGGVYKKGPTFPAPVFAADASTDFNLEKQADTEFHVPDIAGLGISFSPVPALTLNLDAVRVTYSNLVDNFYASNETVRALTDPFEADDVTEIHFGAEYYFTYKLPFALRAGWWRDPAHSVTYRGPLNAADLVAEAILFPEGETQNHWSVGAGLAWPRFQIDAAYDSSKTFKVGSISMIARF